MGLFSWLFLGHLAGDFLLQTRWMAEKKAQEFLPLVVHSAVYTGTVALLALKAGGLSWLGIGLIFLGHLLLDQRAFVNFWAKTVNGNTSTEWLKVVSDQSWHLLILGLATLL